MDIQFLLSPPVLAIAAGFVKARLLAMGIPVIDRGLPPVVAVPPIAGSDTLGSCNGRRIKIVIQPICGMDTIVTLCHEMAHWYNLTPDPVNLASRNVAMSRGEKWAIQEYWNDPNEVTARAVGSFCCHQVAAAISPIEREQKS